MSSNEIQRETQQVHSEKSLVVGACVEYMFRKCKIVGFEGENFVLHSLHQSLDGKPSSTWIVTKKQLIGKRIVSNEDTTGKIY